MKPVASKLRRLPFVLRQKAADKIHLLETSGVIEGLNAFDWVSSLVVLKDEFIRLCVDLREPNKAIVADNYQVLLGFLNLILRVHITSKLRGLLFMLRQKVAGKIHRLETSEVIERVNTSDSVPPFVVVKDESIRLCVDLREPNKAIVADGFPIPNIEELLHQLSGATCFSKLQLASAYHQVELAEESRDLTTFISQERLFHFNRVCFGLTSAPAAFQKMMSQVLKGCTGVLCYLDDILVWGKNCAEHDTNLQTVLSRIDATGMKRNHKCVFGATEVHFLGHCINAQGIWPLK